MIVTIDGPAGSGKSTAARELARRLGFDFLDTGAMYRGVALACLGRSVDLDDEEAVGEIARHISIVFPGNRVFVDGEDVTEEIRTPEVTQASSVVAANRHVRSELAELQRKAAAGRNIVSEGRDQGTVVFPEAECKFFLTADPAERALRRQRDLAQRGRDVPLDDVVAQLRDRDQRDETRTVAPLRPAADAVRIDTSRMSPEEVLATVERIVRDRIAH